MVFINRGALNSLSQLAFLDLLLNLPGCGRAPGARGTPPRPQERPGPQDLSGQPLPRESAHHQLRGPVPGPVHVPEEAGHRGRALHLPSLRPQDQGAAVPGAQRKLRRLEHAV